MRNLKLALAVASLVAFACPALAQTPNILGNEFATQTSGKTVVGLMIMCLNASNQAVPATLAGNCLGSGGGGGAGAVFGPTAVGTAAVNPPVLLGGTVDGTGTGAMSAWKVLSGIGYVNCANCSGSGISVTFGNSIGTVGTPNGFKDASGNFQPILGDVTNGEWVSVKASALPTGAATQTTSAAILTALGSPFQTGGSIGNTSFGATQSGTWTVQPGNTANTTPWLVTVNNSNANGAAAASASSPVTPSNQPIGAASFTPAQVSVGSTATSIAAARTGVSGTGRVSITITNTTTTAIYLGGSGVTTSTGQLLPGIVGASVTINTTAAVYGIVATGTATVTEFETY